MVECLKELSASVYGQPGVECPLYMLRMTSSHMSAKHPYGADQAARFLPHLRKALEAALSESSRLASSPTYQHDLVDIGRQHLSDLFNLHAAGLAKAFAAEDREAFQREASALRQVLNSQEMLLSSSDAYCLAPILAKAKALPGAPENYDERIRNILTVWGGKILDYAHRDYYELVRFYYRKRVEAFLDQANRSRPPMISCWAPATTRSSRCGSSGPFGLRSRSGTSAARSRPQLRFSKGTNSGKQR
jgi:hypothetical protein